MRSEFSITTFIIFVIVLSFSAFSFGQGEGKPVKGTITDINNHPISDVSVSVEGIATEPSVTNIDGEFELSVPSGDAWLIITPVDNYHSRHVYLNNMSEIHIYLTPIELESEDEEVNVLLGAKERRNIISSYKTFDPEKYFFYPYQTIDQYFQGNVSGMYVMGHSGMPGEATTSYIRGIKSLNTNNQPLYIVDGIPLETFGIFGSELDGYVYNPLTSIEPFDITNITILKDNYATTLYGMRGSNGVILIETLKPTELRTIIDFSVKTGANLKPENYIPQLNNVQHRTLANEVLLSSNLLEENFEELYPALYSNEDSDNYNRYKHNTYWQDEIFRVGMIYDVQLRIKGGDEIARYGLSVGYLKQEGVVKTSDFERLNIRLVGTFNIFQWLRMYISTNLSINTSNIVESALSKQTSPILTSLAKTPMMMPYSFDKDGNQLNTLDDIGSLGVSNPYSIFENFRGEVNNYHSLNSIRLEGDISDYFKLNSLFGINLNTLSENVFMPNYGMALYYDGTAYNVSKNVKNYLYSVYNDNSISYKPELGTLHDLKVDAGFRLNVNRFEQDIGISKNSHENDEYESLQHGVFYLYEIGGQNSKWNRFGIYSNLNYSFKNKYLMNFAIIAENSTRLGKNTDLFSIGEVPFATFYSIGTGWRVSSENYLKNVHWLESLKLRVSYSQTGNDDIGNTSAFNYLQVDHYRETSAMVPGNLTDGTLKNETYTQLNTGLDLALWGNRLNFTLDFYNINTTDMLVYEPQPYYVGFSYLPTNNGSLNNQGLELSVFYRVVDHNKFKWDLSFNITPWQTNDVTQIRDDRLITSFPGGEYITQTGHSLLEFYGYQYDGVFAGTKEAEEASLINDKGISFIAGDAKFRDFSGPNGMPDSIINDYDKVALGSPIPEMFGGMNSMFHYGRWSLNVDLYFVSGNEIFNYQRYENEKMSDLSNQSSTTLNRWVYEEQETYVPRALWDDPVGNSSFSSRWIEDGSFLRIQNLTLGYTVPDKFLVFRNLKVYITGSNLFVFTKYLGYNPEFSYSFSAVRQGVDYGLMPVTRKIIVGVKVGL